MTDEIRIKSNELATKLLVDAENAIPGSPEQKTCIDSFKSIISAQSEADSTALTIYKEEEAARTEWRKVIIDGALKFVGIVVKGGLVVVTLFANVRGWWYPKDPYNEANRIQ